MTHIEYGEMIFLLKFGLNLKLIFKSYIYYFRLILVSTTHFLSNLYQFFASLPSMWVNAL